MRVLINYYLFSTTFRTMLGKLIQYEIRTSGHSNIHTRINIKGRNNTIKGNTTIVTS